MNAPLHARLRALRAKLKSLYLATGLARLACEVLGYLVAAYLLDRYVVLPPAVRVTLLIVASLALVLRFHRLVLYPLKKRIRVEDMALVVEHRHRELEGGLASAVELTKVAEAPPQDISPHLLKVWLDQLEATVQKFQFRGIFDLRRLRRLALAAAVLLVGIGGFVVTQRAEASVFVQRLLGRSVEWPRRTHLSIDIPEDSLHYRVERDDDGTPRRVHIARGASLPVMVHIDDRVPDEVFLLIEETGRTGREEEVRMLPSDADARSFTYRFRNLTRPLVMHPQGGDDDGSGLEVEVVVSSPPAVETVIATIDPPVYTGIASRREERQEFRVPVGTRLHLEFATTSVLVSGTLTVDGDPTTAQELTIDPENPKRLFHSMVVQESGTLNLNLVGEDGFKNLVPFDYPVTAIKDRRPSVEMLRPQISSLQVTENGVVPFRLLARDDYGVLFAELLLEQSSDEVVAYINLLRSTPNQAMGAGADGDPVALFHRLDLQDFRVLDADGAEQTLVSGQTLHYVVRVDDNQEAADRSQASNRFEAPARGIELVSVGEKMRKLADRQLRLKQAIGALQKSQEQKLEGLEAVREAAADTAVPELLKELQALEVDQSRIRTKAGQISKDFAEIVEEYVLNRLDLSPTRDRIIDVWVEKMKTADPRSRFDVPGLREILATWHAGDFGQLDTLENMLGWLELGLNASEVHADGALEDLRKARVTSDAEARPRYMQSAADHEREVLALYGQLLEKMVEWETFQEIVDQMRDLLEDQKALNEAYKRNKSK